MNTERQASINDLWNQVEEAIVPLAMSEDSRTAAYARCVASGIPRKIEEWLSNEDGTSFEDAASALSMVYCRMIHQMCQSAEIDKHGTGINRGHAIRIGHNVSNTLFYMLEKGKAE
jgi:hypothetical protein